MYIRRIDLENRIELLGFKAIYERAFPDANERKPYENVISRVGKETENLYTEIYLLFETDDFLMIDELVGGIVFDIYTDINWKDVEIIYLTIDDKFRNSGYGTSLLRMATEELKKNINLRHIFLKVEKPDDTIPQTIQRLRFWKRNGAKRVPIEYKQPSLSENTGWIEDGLDLYILGEDSIPSNELGIFLYNFCKGLGVGDIN